MRWCLRVPVFDEGAWHLAELLGRLCQVKLHTERPDFEDEGGCGCGLIDIPLPEGTDHESALRMKALVGKHYFGVIRVREWE